jgi:hypothetical protein
MNEYTSLLVWLSAELQPNTACTRLGVRGAFFRHFSGLEFSRFESESTLLPQAGNASRWHAPRKRRKRLRLLLTDGEVSYTIPA